MRAAAAGGDGFLIIPRPKMLNPFTNLGLGSWAIGRNSRHLCRIPRPTNSFCGGRLRLSWNLPLALLASPESVTITRAGCRSCRNGRHKHNRDAADLPALGSQNPASLDWQPIVKVEHYRLKQDSIRHPVELKEEPPGYRVEQCMQLKTKKALWLARMLVNLKGSVWWRSLSATAL